MTENRSLAESVIALSWKRILASTSSPILRGTTESRMDKQVVIQISPGLAGAQGLQQVYKPYMALPGQTAFGSWFNRTFDLSRESASGLRAKAYELLEPFDNCTDSYAGVYPLKRDFITWDGSTVSLKKGATGKLRLSQKDGRLVFPTRDCVFVPSARRFSDWSGYDFQCFKRLIAYASFRGWTSNFACDDVVSLGLLNQLTKYDAVCSCLGMVSLNDFWSLRDRTIIGNGRLLAAAMTEVDNACEGKNLVPGVVVFNDDGRAVLDFGIQYEGSGKSTGLISHAIPDSVIASSKPLSDLQKKLQADLEHGASLDCFIGSGTTFATAERMAGLRIHAKVDSFLDAVVACSLPYFNIKVVFDVPVTTAYVAWCNHIKTPVRNWAVQKVDQPARTFTGAQLIFTGDYFPESESKLDILDANADSDIGVYRPDMTEETQSKIRDMFTMLEVE